MTPEQQILTHCLTEYGRAMVACKEDPTVRFRIYQNTYGRWVVMPLIHRDGQEIETCPIMVVSGGIDTAVVEAGTSMSRFLTKYLQRQDWDDPRR